MKFCSAVGLVVLTTGLVPLCAKAATITYTLNQDACSGTCGLSPFATVTITDEGSGSSAYVLVTETLTPGQSERYAGTGAGNALEFQVAGTVTISNVSTNFGTNGSQSQGSYSASAFGSFYHAITCVTCQGGQNGNPAGPLSFDVSSTAGVTTSQFTSNSNGDYFASDIVGSNGNTGNVGSNTQGVVTQSATPEPGTWFMVCGGFVMIGLSRLKIGGK